MTKQQLFEEANAWFDAAQLCLRSRDQRRFEFCRLVHGMYHAAYTERLTTDAAPDDPATLRRIPQ